MDNHRALKLALSDVLKHSKGGFHAEQSTLTCGFQNQKLGIMAFPPFPPTAPFFANRQPFYCFSQGSVFVFDLTKHVMDRAKCVKCRKRECL